MTNLKLMKAQCKLALTWVDVRLAVGIVNYITALEKQVERLEKKLAELEAKNEMPRMQARHGRTLGRRM